jgi:hypothetical protein
MSTTAPTNATLRSARTIGSVRSTGEALHGLTAWLMSESVLRTEAGGAGVANWLWPDGIHDGLYPEIGGYYLQFLALAASGSTASGESDPRTVATLQARDAASRVIAWLDQAGPHGDPLTLYHRDMTQSDWRNKCLFAFDLAMILRGFASVEARWPGIVPAPLIARYAASIQSLIGHGHLFSHRLRPGASENEIPVKWSTRVDVHHVKIAAALAGVGPRFAGVVSATISEQAEALEREGNARMRELHPFLYLIEGWLMLWGQSGNRAFIDYAGTAFCIVLGDLDPERGTLPPIAGRHDLPTRSDVLAQALRAGLILEQAAWFTAGATRQWSIARHALRDALLSRVTPEGGIEFDQAGRHRNVWASLFAWQALGFLAHAGTGLIDARNAAAALI